VEGLNWDAEAELVEGQALWYQVGYCEVLDCADGDGAITWLSELSQSSTFILEMLPAGDPSQGNLTTVVLCVLKMLDGRVVTSSSQPCARRNVEVTQPTTFSKYPGPALVTALQSPGPIADLAATIAAQQLAAGLGTFGGNPSATQVLAAVIVKLDGVSSSWEGGGKQLSARELSQSLSIVRTLASAPAQVINELVEVPPVDDMMRAVMAATSRLVETSNGDAAATAAQADAILVTLSYVIALFGGVVGSVGTPVATHGLLLQVADVIWRVSAVSLEAVTPSATLHSLGPEALQMLLYNGAVTNIVWRSWSFGTDEVLPEESSIRRRRLLREQSPALSVSGRNGVESRKGEAEVTLRDFVSPGCGYARDAPSCMPRSVAVAMTYVSDSSYIYSGLGHEEFRRGAVEAGYPITDQDKVHTVSGVLSVTGSSGALVPELAIQLPLDLQTGMADLREDNKFCCRINYDAMQLVFLGNVEARTVVREFPGGWTVQQHSGLCWADMYADYVLVQISRPAKSTVTRDFVSTRKSNSSTIPVTPPPPSGALSSEVLQRLVLCVGTVLILSLVLVIGCADELRRHLPPCRRRRPPRRPALRFSKLPAVVNDANLSSDQGKSKAVGNATLTSSRNSSLMERFGSPDGPLAVSGDDGDMWAVGTLHQSMRRASSVGIYLGSSVMGSEDEIVDATSTPGVSSRTMSQSVTTSYGYAQMKHIMASRRHNGSVFSSVAELPTSALPDSAESPLLHAAVVFGDTAQLSEAIRGAADLNEPDSTGRTPLHIAAKAGRADIVRTLLTLCSGDTDQGLDPNRVDSRGHTPLHLAAAYGHAAAVEALLSVNTMGMWLVDMETTHHGDNEGGVPKLKSEFANGSVSDDDDEGAAATAVPVVEVNKADASGCTALHVAAHFGSEGAMAALLRRGADVAIGMTDNHGNTPLHLAAMRGHIACLIMMLRHCLKSERVDWLLTKNRQGHVPVDVAAVRGHGDTVEALLLWGEQEGVNVTRPHGDGISLMSLATFHGKRSVTRVIRSNEWWMWEAAPEEEVLDGDKLRQEFKQQSSLSYSFKKIVRQTNGRLSEAKHGLSKMISTISSKYIRTGNVGVVASEHSGPPPIDDEVESESLQMTPSGKQLDNAAGSRQHAWGANDGGVEQEKLLNGSNKDY
jgi:ankyrin repeat protein